MCVNFWSICILCIHCFFAASAFCLLLTGCISSSAHLRCLRTVCPLYLYGITSVIHRFVFFLDPPKNTQNGRTSLFLSLWIISFFNKTYSGEWKSLLEQIKKKKRHGLLHRHNWAEESKLLFTKCERNYWNEWINQNLITL